MATTTLEKYSDGWFQDKWELFLKSFKKLEVKEEEEANTKHKRKHQIDYDPNAGYYFNYINIDMFGRSSKTLVLDYKDIQTALSYGGTQVSNEDLIALDTQVRLEPYEAERALKMATYRILKETHYDYAMEIKDEFKARFKNIIEKKELSDITNKDIGRLFTFEGFVTAVDESTRMLYKTTTWQCKNGHNNEVDGRQKPYKCDTCDKTNLYLLPDASITDTYQEFRLQQRHDQTKDGRMAVERDVVCIGADIVQKVQGGDYVEVCGIVKVREKQTSMSYKKNSDVVDFYIEVSYIEKKPDDTMMMLLEADSMYLEDEVAEAVNPEADTEVQDLQYEKLWRSIAPTVIGHEIVKQVLLLQMASSDSRTFEDGTPHRGHAVLLFCGSPASAKSVMARYIQKVHIRSVFPTGDGLTKAGLTAAVDTKVSPPKLLAGAYLMAKNGIVIIDELQAVKDDIRDAILEATEDAQTITITKAGIHRPLKADCASLHLCNPKETSYWDDAKNIMENTGFKANLLSRYDAVLVFRDIPNPEEDLKKAEHFLKTYTNAVKDIDKPSNVDLVPRKKSPGTVAGLYSAPFMAVWLRYVRKTFHPVLKPNSDAYKVIQQFYLNTRSLDARYFSQGDVLLDDREITQRIPSITMRQLSSLIRLSEASARAHHRNEVTERDAQIACEIIQFSIINSGFNPINKSAFAKNADMSLLPSVKTIDIQRYADRMRDNFYKEADKKASIFETVLKKFAIGKCIYCKGRGTTTSIHANDASQATVDCAECNGYGSTRTPFEMSDVEEALRHHGFTRADVDFWEKVFVDRKIIKKNKYNAYETVKQYSIRQGINAIKMRDASVEVVLDLDGRLKKIKDLADSLPDSTKKDIDDMVEERLNE